MSVYLLCLLTNAWILNICKTYGIYYHEIFKLCFQLENFCKTWSIFSVIKNNKSVISVYDAASVTKILHNLVHISIQNHCPKSYVFIKYTRRSNQVCKYSILFHRTLSTMTAWSVICLGQFNESVSVDCPSNKNIGSFL